MTWTAWKKNDFVWCWGKLSLQRDPGGRTQREISAETSLLELGTKRHKRLAGKFEKKRKGFPPPTGYAPSYVIGNIMRSKFQVGWQRCGEPGEELRGAKLQPPPFFKSKSSNIIPGKFAHDCSHAP